MVAVGVGLPGGTVWGYGKGYRYIEANGIAAAGRKGQGEVGDAEAQEAQHAERVRQVPYSPSVSLVRL